MYPSFSFGLRDCFPVANFTNISGLSGVEPGRRFQGSMLPRNLWAIRW